MNWKNSAKFGEIRAEGLTVSSDYLVDAMRIEPTTCRLRAVKFAAHPGAIHCYKLLSFVHSAHSLLPDNYHLPPRLWPILKYGGDKNGYSLPPPTFSRTTTAILMRLRRIPTRDLYPDC